MGQRRPGATAQEPASSLKKERHLSGKPAPMPDAPHPTARYWSARTGVPRTEGPALAQQLAERGPQLARLGLGIEQHRGEFQNVRLDALRKGQQIVNRQDGVTVRSTRGPMALDLVDAPLRHHTLAALLASPVPTVMGERFDDRHHRHQLCWDGRRRGHVMQPADGR